MCFVTVILSEKGKASLIMTNPVTFNAAAAYGMQNTRFTPRQAVRDTEPEFGSLAPRQNNANACETITVPIGLALAFVPMVALAVASRFMLPSELRTKNIESVLVSKDANDAVLPKTFVVKSKVGETVTEGVLKEDEKSGVFGFFKKATLTFDGTPATTKSVRMMFLPTYLKTLLKKGPDELGSPREWKTTNDALKLGGVDVPKGAKVGTNVYGEQIAVFMREKDYVLVGPTEIGKKDSPVVEKTYTPDKAPAAVKNALRRVVFGPLF